MKDAVNKEVERLRAEKILGSNLEASVVIFADNVLKKQLDQFGEELRFLLITSSARVQPLDDVTASAVQTDVPGLSLLVSASPYEKCTRCWHRREDVGQSAEHPELCGRCLVNIGDEGEVRHYA